MDDSIRRGVRLDPETARMLARLAKRFEGNESMAVRFAIRQAAAIADRPSTRPATTTTTTGQNDGRL